MVQVLNKERNMVHLFRCDFFLFQNRTENNLFECICLHYSFKIHWKILKCMILTVLCVVALLSGLKKTVWLWTEYFLCNNPIHKSTHQQIIFLLGCNIFAVLCASSLFISDWSVCCTFLGQTDLLSLLWNISFDENNNVIINKWLTSNVNTSNKLSTGVVLTGNVGLSVCVNIQTPLTLNQDNSYMYHTPLYYIYKWVIYRTEAGSENIRQKFIP